MTRLPLVLCLALAACSFETAGFESLLGAQWETDARCSGGDEVAMPEDVPTELGPWLCTRLPLRPSEDGEELHISCERGDEHVSVALLCSAGAGVPQWAALGLTGGCQIQVHCR